LKYSLVFQFKGPLQSWSDITRHFRVLTRFEPTKSGIIGLICRALGRPFSDDALIAKLADLDLVIRVDKEGTIYNDFQAARGRFSANGDESPHAHISTRDYLESAEFKVAIGGPADFVCEIEKALMIPAHPLWLGRKSCSPSASIWIPGGLVTTGETPRQVLERWPLNCPKWKAPRRLRLVLDLGVGATTGELRHDFPLSLDPENRRFCDRRVEMAWVNTADLPEAEIKQPEPDLEIAAVEVQS